MNALHEIKQQLGWAESLNHVVRASFSLTDFVQALDARLTALEAKPHTPEIDPATRLRLILTNEENARLAGSLRDISAERDGLRKDVKRLTAEVNDLTAVASDLTTERKALDADLAAMNDHRASLAAQLDDLRNVNAGLRQDNERQSELIAALRENSADLVEAMKDLQAETKLNEDNARLRSALQAVEWIEVQHDEFCAWCNNVKRCGHADDCRRQAALR